MVKSREIFSGMIEEHLVPMLGLFELLTTLKEQGLPKAVTASAPTLHGKYSHMF